MNLAELTPEALASLSDEDYRRLLVQAVDVTAKDRQENQILYYRPVSSRALRFHESKAGILAAGGGNRSSKTTSMLAEMVMCSTGIFPHSLKHLIDQKFQGPIKCRLTVESLTTTLEPVIIPKLQWFHWNGPSPQGGARGHWGLIPRDALIDGDWDKSISKQYRTIRLICRDPYNREKILGESSWQFMSFDQDPSDFASGEFHICGHDEPPKAAQWKENRMRVMSVGGRMLLAMTWPDDPTINVDYLYNDIYEPAKSGTDPNIEWLELWTTENEQIDQESVAKTAASLSTEEEKVRIYGQPIRFSNRIHPEFTEHHKTYCFKCQKGVIPTTLEHKEGIGCPECWSENLVEYCHVEEFETAHAWPTVFLLDPHPRKPHMYLWAQISPSDDWYIVADGKCSGDCVEVRKEVDRVEQDLGLWVAQRLMDPNMGASVSGQRREVTWQDEFASAQLPCDLAVDADVGRVRVNTMLKVDESTHRPRLVIHPRCRDTTYQLLRFCWSDFSKNVDRDQKQTPSDKYSDYPALLRYLANSEPNFRFLKGGAPVIRRPGKRRGAYG